LIVAKDHEELYWTLRGYRDNEFTVLLDRRQVERRRHDRRSRPGITDELRVPPYYALVSLTGAGALAPPAPRPRLRASVTRYLRDWWTWLSGTPTGAQADRDRLRQECEALRARVRQLRAELGRLQNERADVAHWFATVMREATSRFPIAPPPT